MLALSFFHPTNLLNFPRELGFSVLLIESTLTVSTIFVTISPVEFSHIFDSHSSLFPLGLAYSCVVMAFNSFLEHFASAISAARK